MRKLEIVQILKNVGSSWFSLGINILVGIFLSPFILHRLGDSAYGIWILIFSITGYYGLFDLGIRSSVIRYVSKFTATEDNESLSKLVNTSLFTYTMIGLVAAAVTVVGSFFVDSMFKIPADFLGTARWLFLMVGFSVSLGFPLGVFGGILEGLQQFYFLNLTNVGSTLLRALLIVIALTHGYGLLMVALITVVLPLITAVVRAAITLRMLAVRFAWHHVDRHSFGEMANYSSATFIIILAYKLRFKTDEIVIGTMLTSAAITYFSIGDRLLDYASEVVSGLAQIFVPMSSQSEAKGDMERLRKMFVAGNRACALIIFPMAAMLVLLGKSVIEAWVGLKYVPLSYPVMLILLGPMTLLLAQSASPRILFGMARHRTLAWVTSLEGAANVILSIMLVRRFGIIGDAFGTAIPLSLTVLYFLPRYLCRTLGVPLWTFVGQAYLLPLGLCVPLVASLFAMRYWYTPHNYPQLAVQLTLASLVYGAGLAWAVLTHRVWKVGELTPQGEQSSIEGPVPLASSASVQDEA